MPIAQLRVLLLPSYPLRRATDGSLLPDESAAPGWVAICLDYHIVGDGDTLEAAIASFGTAVRAEIMRALEERREPLVDIKPAPERYQRLWQSAKRGQPISIDRPQGDTGPEVIRKVAITAETRVAA